MTTSFSKFTFPAMESLSDVDAVLRNYREDITVTSSVRIDGEPTRVRQFAGKGDLRAYLLKVLEAFGPMAPEHVEHKSSMALVFVRTQSKHTITLALRLDEEGLVRDIRAAHGHRRKDLVVKLI